MDNFFSLEVTAIITRYRPRLAPHLWQPIAEFTRTTVTCAAPPTSYIAREYLSFLAHFALWATHISGLPLTTQAILRQSVIDRYITTQLHTHSAAAQSRAARALGRMASSSSNTPRPATRVKYAQALASPYHPSETPWMWSWAKAQRTELQRINAHAVLGLCRGAGLTTAELLLTRVGDITLAPNASFITIRGANTRRTPIEQSWEAGVHYALNRATDRDDWLISPTARANRREAINKITIRRDRPTPQLHRLRSSWIIDWLNRAPVAHVLEVSGIRTIQALGRHQPYLASIQGGAA